MNVPARRLLQGTVTGAAHPDHPVWAEIYPELQPHDFRYPYLQDVAWLRWMSRRRRRCGVPFRVVSDHRPPERNEDAGGASQSAHLDVPTRCADLRVVSNRERALVTRELVAGNALEVLEEIAAGRLSGAEAQRAATDALACPGATRLGLYPPTADQVRAYGKGAGSVHVDASATNPDPRIWMSF